MCNMFRSVSGIIEKEWLLLSSSDLKVNVKCQLFKQCCKLSRLVVEPESLLDHFCSNARKMYVNACLMYF